MIVSLRSHLVFFVFLFQPEAGEQNCNIQIDHEYIFGNYLRDDSFLFFSSILVLRSFLFSCRCHSFMRIGNGASSGGVGKNAKSIARWWHLWQAAGDNKSVAIDMAARTISNIRSNLNLNTFYRATIWWRCHL